MSINTHQLSPLGVEILDTDSTTLLDDEGVPSHIMDLLDANGVLVFRELGLDDDQQLGFAKRLGEIVVRDDSGAAPGWNREKPGLYTVALDPVSNADPYVAGTVHWHIDGTPSFENPQRASLLSAWALSDSGGDTQFASTYSAYERLSD